MILIQKRYVYDILFWADPFDDVIIGVSVHYSQKQNHLSFNLNPISTGLSTIPTAPGGGGIPPPGLSSLLVTSEDT